MNISDIRMEYKACIDKPVMQYREEITELECFINNHKDDTRAGVVKILEQAEKYRDKLLKEEDRIKGMMSFEHKYRDMGYICGVDEVGRGPLAGPIVTAAVILPQDIIIPYLNDSKQVKEERREELYDIIMERAVSVAVGINSEKVIDDIGIAVADSDAMKQAVENLNIKPSVVLVDAFPIKNLDIKQVSIIKGDTLSVSIAAASIVAKVTRDRMMCDYDKLYPEYDFASNKGYGSAKHIEALKKYGPCDIHRRSFITNFMG